jgi:hypothetical protein
MDELKKILDEGQRKWLLICKKFLKLQF